MKDLKVLLKEVSGGLAAPARAALGILLVAMTFLMVESAMALPGDAKRAARKARMDLLDQETEDGRAMCPGGNKDALPLSGPLDVVDKLDCDKTPLAEEKKDVKGMFDSFCECLKKQKYPEMSAEEESDMDKELLKIVKGRIAKDWISDMASWHNLDALAQISAGEKEGKDNCPLDALEAGIRSAKGFNSSSNSKNEGTCTEDKLKGIRNNYFKAHITADGKNKGNGRKYNSVYKKMWKEYVQKIPPSAKDASADVTPSDAPSESKTPEPAEVTVKVNPLEGMMKMRANIFEELTPILEYMDKVVKERPEALSGPTILTHKEFMDKMGDKKDHLKKLMRDNPLLSLLVKDSSEEEGDGYIMRRGLAKIYKQLKAFKEADSEKGDRPVTDYLGQVFDEIPHTLNDSCEKLKEKFVSMCVEFPRAQSDTIMNQLSLEDMKRAREELYTNLGGRNNDNPVVQQKILKEKTRLDIYYCSSQTEKELANSSYNPDGFFNLMTGKRFARSSMLTPKGILNQHFSIDKMSQAAAMAMSSGGKLNFGNMGYSGPSGLPVTSSGAPLTGPAPVASTSVTATNTAPATTAPLPPGPGPMAPVSQGVTTSPSSVSSLGGGPSPISGPINNPTTANVPTNANPVAPTNSGGSSTGPTSSTPIDTGSKGQTVTPSSDALSSQLSKLQGQVASLENEKRIQKGIDAIKKKEKEDADKLAEEKKRKEDEEASVNSSKVSSGGVLPGPGPEQLPSSGKRVSGGDLSSPLPSSGGGSSNGNFSSGGGGSDTPATDSQVSKGGTSKGVRESRNGVTLTRNEDGSVEIGSLDFKKINEDCLKDSKGEKDQLNSCIAAKIGMTEAIVVEEVTSGGKKELVKKVWKDGKLQTIPGASSGKVAVVQSGKPVDDKAIKTGTIASETQTPPEDSAMRKINMDKILKEALAPAKK